MKTTKEQRERWRLEVMPEPEKLPMGPIHGSHIRQLYERQNRLIADVNEATGLLGRFNDETEYAQSCDYSLKPVPDCTRETCLPCQTATFLKESNNE